jgi:ribosomal-protein-alanine N-acetyltransferase
LREYQGISWPDGFPVLGDGTVSLRRFSADDLDGLFRCFSDPDTTRFIMDPVDRPDTLHGILEEFIHGHERGISLNWAVVESSTGLYAGSVSLQEFSFHDGSAETAFELLPEQRGKGLMTRALSAVARYGFTALGLRRIEARVVEGNVKAERLLEKTGFIPEGTLRDAFLVRGVHRNVNVFGLLSSDTPSG